MLMSYVNKEAVKTFVKVRSELLCNSFVNKVAWRCKQSESFILSFLVMYFVS